MIKKKRKRKLIKLFPQQPTFFQLLFSYAILHIFIIYFSPFASSGGNFHFNIIFIMYFKNYLCDNNFPIFHQKIVTAERETDNHLTLRYKTQNNNNNNDKNRK